MSFCVVVKMSVGNTLLGLLLVVAVILQYYCVQY